MNLTLKTSGLALAIAATLIACNGSTSGIRLGAPSRHDSARDPGTDRHATVAAAVDSDRTYTPLSRAVGGGPVDPSERVEADIAVIKLASAQCNREVRCKDFGPGEKYANRSECVATIEDERRNQLNESNCPRQIGGDALKNCLSALEGDDCDNAIATTARTNACQLSNLCVK